MTTELRGKYTRPPAFGECVYSSRVVMLNITHCCVMWRIRVLEEGL